MNSNTLRPICIYLERNRQFSYAIKMELREKINRKGNICCTISCVVCTSAGGTFIPPMIRFPRKRDNPLLMKRVPSAVIHTRYPSGWIQLELCAQWFLHFLQHLKPIATLPDILILALHPNPPPRENNIRFLSLLPTFKSHNAAPARFNDTG